MDIPKSNMVGDEMDLSLPTPPLLSSSPPTPAPSPAPYPSTKQSWVSSPNVHDNGANHLGSYFTFLRPYEKQQFLSEILDLCNIDQLSFVHAYVSPKLKKDFLKHLPAELGLRILCFVDDPRTLARASQVSRHWYNLLNDDLTWKILCRRHKYRRLSSFLASHTQSLHDVVDSSQASLTQQPASHATGTGSVEPRSTSSTYKSHFKHTYMIDSAWRNRGHTIARHITADYGVVTALHLTPYHIIVALDNAKIHVFGAAGSFIRTMVGHASGVWAIDSREDVLVSGGCDKDVRVWNLRSGECVHALRGHTSTVRCIKMADKHTAVSGSRDTALRVWDLDDGVCKHVLVGHQVSVRCLELHGDLCVSGSYDTTARIWDIKQGVCLRVLSGHFSQIYALAFDGRRVATGSLDTTVRIWEASTGRCVAVLTGHTSLVGQLQMRDQILVTGGSDGSIRVWNLARYKCVHRIAAHDNSVTSLQFDEKRILSGGSDGRVKVWDINTGTWIRDLCSKSTAVWRVGFESDKAIILASRANRMSMEVISFSPVIQTPTTSGFRVISESTTEQATIQAIEEATSCYRDPMEDSATTLFEMTD